MTNPSEAGGRAAALLPVVSRIRRRASVSGVSHQAKDARLRACWHGYLLLAMAVLLWLALMDAGHRSSSDLRHGPQSLRHGKPGMQLQDLGRLLLTSSTDDGGALADTKKPFVWNARNIATMGLAFAVGALANAVGIGGGAFFVPLFNILLGFSLKGSTALSQAIITGGAVASVASALGGRHPVDPSKPLIDYTTALMLTPVLLLGTSVGVLLNVLFPDWLLTFLLTALLLWLTVRIGRKAARLYKTEKQTRDATAAARGGTELQPQRRPSEAQHQQPPHAERQGSESGSADGGSRHGAEGGVGSSRHGGAAARRRLGRGEVPKAGELPPVPPQQPQRKVQSDVDHDSAVAKAEAAAKAAGSRSGSMHGEMAYETIPAIGMPPVPRSPMRSLSLRAGSGSLPDAAAVARLQHSSSLGQGEEGATADRSPGLPPLLPAVQPVECPEAVVLDITGAETAAAAYAVQPKAAGSDRNGEESARASGSDSNPPGSSPEASDQEQNHEEEVPKPGFPFLQLVEVFVLWGCFLGLQLGKSRFARCSAPYFVLFAVQVALSLSANVLFTYQARRAAAAAARQASSQPMLRPQGPYNDPSSWGLKLMVRSSLIMLVGGSIAGLLGIGGGMIVSPLLLELGVHPLVGASTSSLMVLFSASTAALAFAFDHLLNVTYALVYGIGCFVASLAGVWLVGMAVRRSGRASYVVIILAGIIGLGAVLTGVFGGRKAIEALEAHQGIGFHAFC